MARGIRRCWGLRSMDFQFTALGELGPSACDRAIDYA